MEKENSYDIINGFGTYIYIHIIHIQYIYIIIWIINHLQSGMHIEGKHTKMFEVHLTWG